MQGCRGIRAGHMLARVLVMVMVFQGISLLAFSQPDQWTTSPARNALAWMTGLVGPGEAHAEHPVCDVDGDGDVDAVDIQIIFDARGETATGPDDPRDANHDGVITINDGRQCVLECSLEVTKTCLVMPPPPSGKCKGKLQQFTVTWTGDPISISGVPNDAPGGAVAMGQAVTFFGPFSSNDVVVDISGDPDGTQSTFHVSCSDEDMNTPDDCGKLQGNGKGTDGVNKWALEGWIDADGTVLECSTPDPVLGTTSSCEFQAIPPICDKDAKPDVLTFLFTGGGCGASDNDQAEGKATCSDSITDGESVMVTLDNGDTLGPIDLGGSFDVPRTSNETTILLTNAGGTETNTLHTSCSQPLVVNDIYGSMTLLAFDGVGVGANVLYSYLVSNDGTQTVNNITVVDDVLGPVDGSPLAFLGPGESEVLTMTTFVAASVGETITNTVTVKGDVAACLASASATVTALPPPPCAVSGDSSLELRDDKIKWKLFNNGFQTATIDTIVFSWPDAHGFLKEVKRGKHKIFDTDVPPPSVTLGPGDWIGDIKHRQIKAGDDEKYEFKFSEKFKDHVPADFSITVFFEEGCSVEFNP